MAWVTVIVILGAICFISGFVLTITLMEPAFLCLFIIATVLFVSALVQELRFTLQEANRMLDTDFTLSDVDWDTDKVQRLYDKGLEKQGKITNKQKQLNELLGGK